MLYTIDDTFPRPTLKARSILAGVVHHTVANRVVEGRARAGQKNCQDHGVYRKDDKRYQRNGVIGSSILLNSAVGSGRDSSQSPENRSDQQKPQTHPNASAHFLVYGAAIDGVAEVGLEDSAGPALEALEDWGLVIEVELIESRVHDFRRRRRVPAFKIGSGVQSGRSKEIGEGCCDDDQNDEVCQSAQQESSHAVSSPYPKLLCLLPWLALKRSKHSTGEPSCDLSETPLLSLLSRGGVDATLRKGREASLLERTVWCWSTNPGQLSMPS